LEALISAEFIAASKQLRRHFRNNHSDVSAPPPIATSGTHRR
jgi:hypothetical protein